MTAPHDPAVADIVFSALAIGLLCGALGTVLLQGIAGLIGKIAARAYSHWERSRR